jgi:D-beta-D-heptose 7-phosphate kinase/D-beta-D-heptose 1-phosphate adenosyltransferase
MALDDLGVSQDGILEIEDRATTKKTRIVAHAQQVVRFDRETEDPLPQEIERRLLEAARTALDGASGLIVSDYEKGTVTASILEGILPEADRRGLPVVVDPKPALYRSYRPITAITPNVGEASRITGVKVRNDEDAARVAGEIRERLGCRAVLLTRGDKGMLLCEEGSQPRPIAASAREVFDVTGAGDTVAATFVLALAAGASFLDAAELANTAAGVVVGKVGTAAATIEELLGAA